MAADKSNIELKNFSSQIVDRLRNLGNVLGVCGSEIMLPSVFGFCRGVKRALTILDQACEDYQKRERKLYLLGEIIHNPWVNDYFRNRGVTLLEKDDFSRLDELITCKDGAIIPAFGVSPQVERKLNQIGCEIIDTTCGDVRRLWVWAERAAGNGFGVLVFGRAKHDETVVTKNRLAEAGGKYLVVGNLDQTNLFCESFTNCDDPEKFKSAFSPDTTNAESLEPFERLAQVSQTTMLFDDTMEVRRQLHKAFERRFSKKEVEERLLFEPTVCRATQDRQGAAVALCQKELDLVIVVGGFGSSNTHHLYELAKKHSPAFLIEDSCAILSADKLNTMDFEKNEPQTISNWLPGKRPLRIGVLAGASSPEIVVGEVIEKLSKFLSKEA